MRLVPGQSRSAAAITVSLDSWLRRLIILPDLRDALDRVSEGADRVARTYMSHPDPGGMPTVRRRRPHASRGWGYWNEQALALEGLARLCTRLVAARAIARRDLAVMPRRCPTEGWPAAGHDLSPFALGRDSLTSPDSPSSVWCDPRQVSGVTLEESVRRARSMPISSAVALRTQDCSCLRVTVW